VTNNTEPLNGTSTASGFQISDGTLVSLATAQPTLGAAALISSAADVRK
jgi:hypothetical protein